jgi:hypothetical protein
MNAKPSISRKTFQRMPNQIQSGRKSYDTRDALTLYGPFLRTNSLISFPVELGSPITGLPANLPDENSDEAVLSYEQTRCRIPDRHLKSMSQGTNCEKAGSSHFAALLHLP